MAELRAGVEKYPQCLVNVRLEHASDLMKTQELKLAVQEVEHQLADRGRVLLRPSGTEPLMRVMVEGRDSSQVHTLADQLANRVRELG